MGIDMIVVAASVAVSAAMSAYALLSKPKGNKDGMRPAGLDEFGVTQAREGMVVPLVYGRVRLPGNIVWYGNLLTEEIIAKPQGGGKGAGSSKGQVSGYRYYMDMWQAICLGRVALVRTYIQDAEEEPAAASAVFNDGTGDEIPDFAPEYGNRMSGVAHVSYQRWYLGDSASVPTVHFVVDRVLEHPALPSQNLANGSNPATVVFDLLVQSGVTAEEIDLASFVAASLHWAEKGYGLNFALDQATEIDKVIEEVLNDVDGVFHKTNEGKYAIRPVSPGDQPAMLLDHAAMSEFSFNRKTWSQVPNFFTANYTDESAGFVQRSIRTYNPAAIRLAGLKNPMNIDLKNFRDLTTASRRLFELAKRNSYPAATVQVRTNLAASVLRPGDVVSIRHGEYGILNARFRVTEIETAAIDKNETSFEAAQQVETLFDDVFSETGGSLWENPDLSPVPLVHARVFELPYNSRTGFEPGFLVLAAREKLVETSAAVMVSPERTQGYAAVGEISTFSQRGTLDEDYPVTREIDVERGIFFTAYRNDPEFETISETELFSLPRFAVVGDEMVAFREVLPLGGNSFRLLGCVRGILGSAVSHHWAGDEIWLANLGNNVVGRLGLESFWLKIVPESLGARMDPGDASPIEVSVSNRAKRPRTPTWVTARRTGIAVSVQVYPSTPGVPGAGDSFPGQTDSPSPFPVGVSAFAFAMDGGPESVVTTAEFALERPGPFVLSVRSLLFGFVSDSKLVAVGAEDGMYRS